MKSGIRRSRRRGGISHGRLPQPQTSGLLSGAYCHQERLDIGRSTKRFHILFLPASAPVLEEIATAQSRYDHVRFAGFKEDELIRYAYFTEKIKKNIQKQL